VNRAGRTPPGVGAGPPTDRSLSTAVHRQLDPRASPAGSRPEELEPRVESQGSTTRKGLSSRMPPPSKRDRSHARAPTDSLCQPTRASRDSSRPPPGDARPPLSRRRACDCGVSGSRRGALSSSGKVGWRVRARAGERPSGPTSATPGHRATGPPGHRATGPPGHRATGPPGHRRSADGSRNARATRHCPPTRLARNERTRARGLTERR